MGEGRARLTNHRAASRLRVFEALEAIHSRLAATPGSAAFVAPLMRFSHELLAWAERNIDAEHHEELARMRRAYFGTRFTPAQVTLLAYDDPALAGRIVTLLRGEAA